MEPGCRHYQHADNAYVGGSLVQRSPRRKPAARLLNIWYDDTDFVAAEPAAGRPADAEVARWRQARSEIGAAKPRAANRRQRRTGAAARNELGRAG